MLILLSLAACASSRKPTPRTEGTFQEEVLAARELLPEVRRSYPASRDPDLQNYVAHLGARIVQANGLEGAPYAYTFTVVETPMVNAFALPAGRIFVTVPLLAAAESEAELAGVLGHEIGHVEAHHAARRIQARKNARSESWWYGAGGAVAGGIVGGVGASVLCPGSGTACTQQLVGMSAVAGVSAGLLIQKYGVLANDQENELEADRIGFQMASKAGYSASHVGDFYRRLQKIWNESQAAKTAIRAPLMDGMSTHPPSAARVQQMQSLESLATSQQGVVSTPAFEQIRRKAASIRSD